MAPARDGGREGSKTDGKEMEIYKRYVMYKAMGIKSGSNEKENKETHMSLVLVDG
jgi:hypothetical protein